jgi:acetyl esterase/lipase
MNPCLEFEMTLLKVWTGLFFGLVCGVVTMAAVDVPEWTPAEIPVGGLPTFETESYKRGILIPLWPKQGEPMVNPFPEVEQDAHLYRVDVPTLEFFNNAPLNDPHKKMPVILVAPGGGYGCLSYKKEGVDIARRLKSMNCHTAVLKYRVNCENAREWAHLDALRALTILKENAEQLGIETDAIGMMGFSAGAHLTATILAHKGHPLNFAILMYPAYLSEDGITLKEEVVPAQPFVPTFVMQCRDDRAYVNASLGYVNALTKANAPITYHLYSQGGHGFGGRSMPGKELYMWTSELRQWFQVYIENRPRKK